MAVRFPAAPPGKGQRGRRAGFLAYETAARLGLALWVASPVAQLRRRRLHGHCCWSGVVSNLVSSLVLRQRCASLLRPCEGQRGRRAGPASEGDRGVEGVVNCPPWPRPPLHTPLPTLAYALHPARPFRRSEACPAAKLGWRKRGAGAAARGSQSLGGAASRPSRKTCNEFKSFGACPGCVWDSVGSWPDNFVQPLLQGLEHTSLLIVW